MTVISDKDGGNTVVMIETPPDLSVWAGKKIGSSDWFTVEQHHIDQFAALTGDDHWIHIDVERARREMPDGKTIAHGFFILSLIPLLVRSVYQIKKRGRGLNYGANKLRFTNPVQVGARVRLNQTILGTETVGEGANAATRIRSECSFEIEGKERPALVAEFIVQVYHA